MAIEKNDINDLAIFGGGPVFTTPLHVGKPYLVDREFFLQEVNGILDREYYTNYGPVLAEFEQAVAERTNVKHCIAVCNGTKALEISTRALGMTGEVIVPSFTFIATAHALYWQGITPVFCDIEADTHQIDVDRIESLITSRTTGILAVHLWGAPCNIGAIEALAERRGLKLVFDASHSFGSTYQDQPIGSFGDAEIVSFHATKLIQTFEGGAVLTNNDELSEKVRFMTNFGFAGYDKVEHIGTNGKLSEIHAAMGLSCIQQLDDTLYQYHKRYELYKRLLKDIRGIRLVPQEAGSNHQYVVIEVTHSLPEARDLLCSILQQEGIIARRYFFPGCHNMAPYNTFRPHPDLPVTDDISSKVIVLPTGPAIKESDVETVVRIIDFSLGSLGEINQAMISRNDSI